MLGLLYLSLVEDGKSMNVFFLSFFSFSSFMISFFIFLKKKKKKYFSYMQFIVRDGFSFVISKLKIFIHKYSQLLKLPRKQVWIFNKYLFFNQNY